MTRHTLRSFVVASIFALALAPPAGAQWTPLNPVVDAQRQPEGALTHPEDGIPAFESVHGLDCPCRLLTGGHCCASPRLHRDEDELAACGLHSAAAGPGVRGPEDGAAVHQGEPRELRPGVPGRNGKPLAQEDSRTLTPVEVNGEKTLHSERFTNMWATQEAFYGLGQHQGGVWNYRGEAVDISQDNTNISVPFLLSSNGYGTLLEQRIAQPVQQPLRARLLLQLGSRRRHRLLLHLRPRFRQARGRPTAS